MRIRKRLHSLITPTDLSSPPPPSTAARAVLPVAASRAAAGEQGEVTAAAGRGGGLHGSGGGSGGGGGGGAGGEGGRGLHPNRDLVTQNFHGCTTKPTSPPPSHPTPPGAATPEGEERSDLAPPGGRFISRDVAPFDHNHRGEVPKRKRDGENGGEGDARRRRPNTVALAGATVAAPKSLGAEAPEPSLGRGGCTTALPDCGATAAAKAEDASRWSDEERGFPLKKRSWCCRAPRGTRSGGDEEEEAAAQAEGKMVVEREMKQPSRPSNTRRRRAAASSCTTMATAGNVLTSAGIGNGGAPTATGDGAGATKKCDDVAVKEEGGDVTPAAAAAPVVGNRGGHGNGKKRRSPAVLMEGSRCSRVNGRGWRCCQQTLVGYSLCEHHLGKGRLRSMSSVRCNGRAGKKEDAGDHGAAAPPLPSLLRQQDQGPSGDGDYEEEEITNPTKRKRRNKIGMVKARSISSLLHLPAACSSTPTAMAAPEPCPSPSPPPATGPLAAAASYTPSWQR